MPSLPPLALPVLAAALAALGSAATAAPAVTARADFSNLLYRGAVDKEIRVAFLGGSITQNGSGHVKMVPDWLARRFPGAEVGVINAGLSSTCSVTGAFRVAEEVLALGPLDLLVVEFAVNDDQDAAHDRDTAVRGMEGIIRQVRQSHPAAEILMVHFVNPEMLELVQSGGTPDCIAAHEAVAEHWGVTSVNVTAALAEAMDAGSMSWEAYGGVHPKPEGYQFASDLITGALDEAWEGQEPPAALAPLPSPPAPLDPWSYGSPRDLDLEQVSWLGGWRHGPASEELLPLGAIRQDYRGRSLLRGDEAGAMLYLDFQGRALAAFVLAGPDAGALEVSIDGGEWRQVVLHHHHSASLNYPRTVILADELAPGYHLAALRIAEESPEGSQGHAASILKLSVNE